MSIELHTWNTPNGRKISVALEEMGLPYTVKTVNISKGEQFSKIYRDYIERGQDFAAKAGLLAQV